MVQVALIEALKFPADDLCAIPGLDSLGASANLAEPTLTHPFEARKRTITTALPYYIYTFIKPKEYKHLF